MDYFRSLAAGRILLLRLDRGDLLLESIARMIEGERIANGVVLSGIGTLDRCVLHMVTTTGFPPVEYFAIGMTSRWNSPRSKASSSAASPTCTRWSRIRNGPTRGIWKTAAASFIWPRSPCGVGGE